MFTVKKIVLLGVNVVIKFFAVGLGFYTSFWLNSNLDSSELRLYNLVISFTPVILSLIDMGLPSLMQKAYTNNYNPNNQQSSKENTKDIKDTWATLNTIRFVTYFIGIGLIYVLQPLSNVSDTNLIIALFTAQFILLSDLNYQAVCNAIDKAWQYSISDLISKISLIIGLFFFTFGFNGSESTISPVWYFAVVSLIANAVALLTDAGWQLPHTKWGKFQWGIVQNTLAPIFLLSIGKIIFSSYLTTHRLFLDRYVDSEVLNGYTNASRLLEIATIIPSLTMPTIASIVQRQFISRESQNQQVFKKLKLEKLGDLIAKIFRVQNNFELRVLWEWIILTLVLGIFCYIGLAVLGPVAIWIIQLNRNYPSAYQALAIMAIGILPTFISTFTSNILVFNGHEKLEVASIFITGIITLSLYFVLIPVWGLVGAAFASSLSFFILAFTRTYFTIKVIQQGKIKFSDLQS